MEALYLLTILFTDINKQDHEYTWQMTKTDLQEYLEGVKNYKALDIKVLRQEHINEPLKPVYTLKEGFLDGVVW